MVIGRNGTFRHSAIEAGLLKRTRLPRLTACPALQGPISSHMLWQHKYNCAMADDGVETRGNLAMSVETGKVSPSPEPHKKEGVRKW
jgi:hypothetical protein